mmetsp:Transcript_9658/g.17370  ORF Transcript_9658/g.17370 Transcript_9658/m.17370 type:complete len:204 (+) Transcript_9658:242-853(+)
MMRSSMWSQISPAQLHLFLPSLRQQKLRPQVLVASGLWPWQIWQMASLKKGREGQTCQILLSWPLAGSPRNRRRLQTLKNQRPQQQHLPKMTRARQMMRLLPKPLLTSRGHVAKAQALLRQRCSTTEARMAKVLRRKDMEFSSEVFPLGWTMPLSGHILSTMALWRKPVWSRTSTPGSRRALDSWSSKPQRLATRCWLTVIKR